VLLTVLLEAIIVIALESVLFAQLVSEDIVDITDGPARGLPIYLIIFILSQVFQVVLVFDAISNKNTIQILGFVFFNLCCFMYSILQVAQVRAALLMDYGTTVELQQEWKMVFTRMQTYIIVVIVVTALCEIFYGWMALRMYKEFGWSVYKKIGADIQKKRMYRNYHILLMLLKLDVFFFLGFALQFLLLVLRDVDLEKGLTIAALPITLVIIISAVFAVRRERKPIMIFFICGVVLAIVYFLYKTVRIWTDPKRATKYTNVSVYLTVFSVLSLLVSMATLVMSIVCFRDFGKGLKPYLTGEKDLGKEEEPGNRRIVLDDEDDDIVHEQAAPVQQPGEKAAYQPTQQQQVYF
jgi:hypothetical protein